MLGRSSLRRRLRVERLEHRNLLAGNVLVTVNGGGNLTIRGDAADNQFSVQETAPDVFTFTDTDPVGDTRFNGALGPFVIAGVTGSVRADLQAGNDNIEILGGTEITGNLQVKAGAGNDTAILTGVAIGGGGVDVAGNAVIETGAGNDTVRLIGAFLGGGVNVGGDAVIQTGAGNDTVDLASGFLSGSVDVGGNLDVHAGQGDDAVTVAETSVVGNTTIDTSDGLDDVNIDFVTAGGNLTVRLGHQDDNLRFHSSNVTAAVALNASLGHDTLDVRAVQADSGTIDTSDGNDIVSLDSITTSGDLTIRLGLGDDTLGTGATAGFFVVGGRLSVNASRGNDTVSLVDFAVAGATTIDTSDGVDEVTLLQTTFAALSVALGHDNDTLTVTFSSATSANLNGSAGNADTYDGSSGGNTGALDPALVTAALKGFEIILP
jgi:hypothetical protein